MYKKVLATVAVAALSTLGLSAPTADASHSWNNYHWARTSNPFNLKLGDNVDSRWDSYLGTTSADWSASTVLDTTIVAGSTTGRKCAATLGRVEVCNAAYGQRGWLGIASINISGSHITQGTVKLNDTYFDTAKYNTPAWRNVVSCQEVGHTLGLDHQDEDFNNADLGTCMDYSNNPEPNQHPNTHDYQMLESIYSHTDSTSTVGAAAPTSSTTRVGNTPKAWGHRVDGSR
ncbi:MAG: hypothetical protein H0U51_00235, partial [Propionibacteriales bacterium]|nr:hypothetical protein [Propionibacteriales bacterium]